jgi:Leucine-rich repeat (LRR) protein
MFPQSLKVIYLDHNQIEEIKDEFDKCVNLEILNISNNAIKKISDNFLKNKKLKILNLSNNALVSIPKKGYKSVEELVISHNKISELPQDLIQLNFIDFSFNKIKEVPSNIFNENILKIFGAYNEIKALPKIQIIKNTKLNEILLGFNQIEKLQDNFFEIFPNIKIFDISYNQISVLPSLFYLLTYNRFN